MSDHDIRSLERAASQGDTDAAASLQRERCRQGHCACSEPLGHVTNWSVTVDDTGRVAGVYVEMTAPMGKDARDIASEMVRRLGIGAPQEAQHN